MRHIGLYSPYVPKHAGGGEKYLLTIAEVASKSAKASFVVPQSDVGAMRDALPRYGEMFGLDLSNVNVIGSGIGSSKGPVRTLVETKRFSHFFAMTDGSVFPTLASRSYFITQVPWTRPLSLPEKIKLKTWTRVLVYSEFVKKVIEKSWKLPSISVVSPYVDLDAFVPSNKEKIVLNVGRFFRHTTSNSKRQDVVIDAFKKLTDKGILKNYSLVLIGNIDPNPDSQKYIEELKERAHGYPVNFLTDLSYTKLREYYARSEMYWHAAGFGVDPDQHPENTEHFGMTTLEAMASGCIPLVVPYGGQQEIVKDAQLFWESIDELADKTNALLSLSAKKKQVIQDEMMKQVKTYSKDIFTKQIEKLIS